MSREVALTIGVANAPPLPYLAGAVNGAHALHDWASKLGYEAELLTDEEEPVTIGRLRQALESILRADRGTIHRLLLYFAGHGLIREIEEGLWLLSDWSSELRAVAIEGLKRRLYMHDIQQISVFADCCRSLPANITAKDLCPDPVLGRGPVKRERPPAIDKFIATQDGTATFMVPGKTPEEDRCLFSGVLMEGLWGTKAEAFSKLLTDKVTSRSLGAFLDVEVPRRAGCYQRTLVPIVIPTFPEGDDVYYHPDPSHAAPVIPEWPSARDAAGMDLRDGGEWSLAKNAGKAAAAAQRELVEKIVHQVRPMSFETRAGFAVDGASVRAMWTPANVLAEPHGQPHWWRLRHASSSCLETSAPVLIEFEDGMFAATAAMPNFIATVLRDHSGVSAVIYRQVYAPVDTARIAEAAIAKMEGGALRANDVFDLATALRQEKHADPMLGVIGAYLYDSVGDVDNIRRMAFYYVAHQQPIPYDVALLARLRGEWRGELLWAHVPAVQSSVPRTRDEERLVWTHSSTPETAGEVGGMWPWMRQGWTFLDDPADDGSTLISSALIDVAPMLAPGRFTLVSAEGGRKLAMAFRLERRGS